MLISVACGGKFADDTSSDPNATDAAVAPESAPFPPPTVDAAPPPPPSACTDTVIDVVQTGDVCEASEKWSCTSEHYELRCDCPSGTCECLQNGIQKKAFTGVQCPGCIEPQDEMKICGFPH